MDEHVATMDGLGYTSSVKIVIPTKPKKPKTEVTAPAVEKAKDDGDGDAQNDRGWAFPRVQN